MSNIKTTVGKFCMAEYRIRLLACNTAPIIALGIVVSVVTSTIMKDVSVVVTVEFGIEDM